MSHTPRWRKKKENKTTKYTKKFWGKNCGKSSERYGRRNWEWSGPNYPGGERRGELNVNNKNFLEALTVKEFTVDPGVPGAEKQYDFCIKKLELYLARLGANDDQKLDIQGGGG